MRKNGSYLAVRVLVLVLVGSVLLIGCKSAQVAPAARPAPTATAAEAAKPSDISGTYALVSINGGALPYTMTHEPPGVRVTSGAFVINADGTCVSKMAFVVPSGEAMSREVNATWTRDGSKLTMVWQGAGTNSGTIEGDTFTMENEGQLFTYRKAP